MPQDSQDPAEFGTALYAYSIPPAGFDQAGNITAYSDTVNGTWSATYDTLNRLSMASFQLTPNAPIQNLCWKYDSFGNRLGQEIGQEQCNPVTIPALPSAPNNQVSPPGFSYDAAGNLQTDTANAYLYDGEGRMCAMQRSIAGTVVLEGYLYDAEGARVAKGTLTSFSCDMSANGFVATQETFADEGGDSSVVVGAGGGTKLYVDGALVLSGTALGGHYNLNDWLGTRRVQTDTAGNVEATFANLPFGDTGQVNADPNDASSEHFTGQEHDTSSGLDFYNARYYSSGLGRFTSPDPDLGSIDLAGPQTLNRYAYVLNSPLILTDPSGMDCVESGQGSFSGDDCSAYEQAQGNRLLLLRKTQMVVST